MGKMKTPLLAVLLMLVAAFNLGYHISHQPIVKWDEARHIAQAMEMLGNHEFVITHYMGMPDYWYAKPPLSTWVTALGCHLFDNKFLGARFFFLMASALLLLLTFLHARRLANTNAGLFAALLVVTAVGLVVRHGLRTADPDALLMVEVSAAMLALSFEKRWSVALAWLLLGVAFLTKSFHAMPYGLVVFVYTLVLWRRQKLTLPEVLLLPWLFLIPVLPWAWARWQFDGSRFFEIMFFYDVLKRSSEVIEGHQASVLLYVDDLFRVFTIPILLTICGLCSRRVRDAIRSPDLLLILLWIGLPLLVYSVAKTRLYWYTYPIYPAVAIFAAVLLHKVLPLFSGWQRSVLIGLLALGIVVNEVHLRARLDHPETNPVDTTLVRLSGQHPDQKLSVYLEDGEWAQDHYATALLLGNVQPLPGGRGAFLKSPEGHWLIHEDGSVSGGR